MSERPAPVDAPFALTGSVDPQDARATRASAFKLTLLRRLYVDIHVDPDLARRIRHVSFDRPPPRVCFDDGVEVTDHGSRISASRSTDAARVTMIAMAKAKGWSVVTPKGTPEFVRAMALDCARAGLRVSGVPKEVQALADAALAHARAAEADSARKAQAALRTHLASVADHEAPGNPDARQQERKPTSGGEMTAEAKAVMDALDTRDDPESAVLRAVAEDLTAQVPRKSETRGAPRPAPDAARADPQGARRIHAAVLKNDHHELEMLKRLDIARVAEACGWEDVSRNHADGHADSHGMARRTYRRGSDTIKCSIVDGRWLWTSNKSGASGSVIDLWLHDNPGAGLGAARIALRNLAGMASVPVVAPLSPPVPPHRDDHTAARQRWEAAPFLGASPSYAERRGIARETLMRFRDEVRVGPFGGTLFAHRTIGTGDILGFEQRREKDGAANTTRFAKGGRKTVNVLGDRATAARMVILEGGLDALALAEIENRADTLYVSTAGGFGAMTAEALVALAGGRQVLCGFDNDAAGGAMAEQVRALVPGACRLAPPRAVEGSRASCKDWLDVLAAMKAQPAADITPGSDPALEPRQEEDWDEPGF